MFSVKFDIPTSFLDSFVADYTRALDRCSEYLGYCTTDACVEAVRAMQGNHPYTDRTRLLTDGMRVRIGRKTRWTSVSEVRFEAPYANIVNDGSKTAKPYPFVPIGIHAADTRMERCIREMMTIFCHTAAGGG